MMDYEQIKTLAKAHGMRINDLLALAPKNDPFYTGTPAALARANWFLDVYEHAGFGLARAPHLRRVHYWTVSQEPPILMPDGLPYENTERCWEFMIEAGKAARYLGYVPMAGIVDNKNPNPHIHALYTDQAPGYTLDIPDLAAPYIWIEGITNAVAQPYHLEVWCEKSTMNDVLLPICQRYGANLVTFEGEVSITAVCVNLMARIEQSGLKPTRIFYISDFDPAGNSMPVAMSRKLEFSIAETGPVMFDVRVRPLALDAAQVRRYRLPRIPIKETEKRAGRFESAFGVGAVELDALEAIRPGELGRMLSEALRQYYSQAAANEAAQRQSELRAVLEAQITAITDRYQEEIAALNAMQDELRAIDVDASEYGIERFDPDVDEDDDWLFDSQRGYVDQLVFYKRHKGS